MIILDTNIISALMQAVPDTEVIDWLDSQPPTSIWTTSISVFEVLYGLNIMATGKRQRALQESFEQALQQDFKGRVLDFDVAAAKESASISAKLRSIGRPVEIRDVQIAGIVAARHATLATRNTKHFVDSEIPLVSP